MRHVAVDVETTGLNATIDDKTTRPAPEGVDRVISVACVELVDRQLTGKTFYRLVYPERSIPKASSCIHGITDEQVAGQPRFSDLVGEFIDFVRGAELLAHNLEFDRRFLDEELRRAGREESLKQLCRLTCTLKVARNMPWDRSPYRCAPPRYNLDDLSIHLGVASEARVYPHDALEDARLAARVWLKMTQEQGSLGIGTDSAGASDGASEAQALSRQGLALARFEPGADDLKRHREMLEMINGKSEQGAAWLKDFKEA